MLKSNKLKAISALVKEEANERRWSHAQLATEMQMHGHFDVVYKFLDGKYPMSLEIANGLEKAFGVRADWWLALNDLLLAVDAEEVVMTQ